MVDGDVLLVLIDEEFGSTTVTGVELIGVLPSLPADLPDGAALGELHSLPTPRVAFRALESETVAARVGAELVGGPQTIARGLPADRGRRRCSVGGRWLVELSPARDRGAADELQRLAPAAAQLGRPGARRELVAGVSIVSRELGAPVSGLEWASSSLSELVERRCRPDELRVDPGAAAQSLGRVLGEFHGAMAGAGGAEPLDVGAFVDRQMGRLRDAAVDEVLSRRVRRALDRLAHVEDLGGQIEIHGELGLMDVVNASGEWSLLGGAAESNVDTPLADLAALISGVSAAAVGAASVTDPADAAELDLLCTAWSDRVVERLVAGYVAVPTAAVLLPADRASRDAFLTVLELCAGLLRRVPATPIASFPKSGG